MIDIPSEQFQYTVRNQRIQALKSLCTLSSKKGRVLHLHGFPGGQASEFTQLQKMFAVRGYDMISINYPGMWNSDGYFSLENTVETLKDIIEIETQDDHETIFIYGESFGGYIATIMASLFSDQIGKIAIRSPFPGLHLVDPTKNPQFSRLFMQSATMMIQSGIIRVDPRTQENFLSDLDAQYNLKSHLESLSEKEFPIYAFVGRDDEILPFREVQAIYEPYTQFEAYDNLSHNMISRDQWIEILTKIDVFFSTS